MIIKSKTHGTIFHVPLHFQVSLSYREHYMYRIPVVTFKIMVTLIGYRQKLPKNSPSSRDVTPTSFNFKSMMINMV